MFVCGDLKITPSFSPPDKFNPVRGPVPKINKLSGPSASVLGFSWSYKILAPTPLPPI